MTGIITSRIDKGSRTFLTLLQDMEYIHGQMFERAVETCFGAVTCLPGALSCFSFSAFRKMAKYYFDEKVNPKKSPFDYGKFHLGEDRWLTHLFMLGAEKAYKIGLCTGAFCKTEACSTWNSLLDQRIRWFKGFITNEVPMLCDNQLWGRYPLLLLYRLLQATIRTTALLMALCMLTPSPYPKPSPKLTSGPVLLAIATGVQGTANLPLPLIGLSLGLN